jgi:tripartite-type tricarboxylate transporter receptor subunit TctC
MLAIAATAAVLGWAGAAAAQEWPKQKPVMRPNTPAEFADYVRAEVRKWAQAVKDSGAKAD